MKRLLRWLLGPDPDELIERHRAELEAAAFTAPNGKRYVTYDPERTARLLARPSRRSR